MQSVAVYHYWSAIPLRDPSRARALSRSGMGSSRRTKRRWVGHEARKARASCPVQTTVMTAKAARRGLCRNRARARPAHRPASGVPSGSRSQRCRFGHLAHLTAPREVEFRRSLPAFRRWHVGYEATHRHLQHESCETPTNREDLGVVGHIEARGDKAPRAPAAAQPQPASRSARATAVRMPCASSACH